MLYGDGAVWEGVLSMGLVLYREGVLSGGGGAVEGVDHSRK